MNDAKCNLREKFKTQKEKLENNKLKKSLWCVREPVDTAGSYQLLAIITGKSGTFCDHIQICHRHVLPHLLPSVSREEKGFVEWDLKQKSCDRSRCLASTF